MRQLVAVRLLEKKKKEPHFDNPKKLFSYIRQIVIRELPRELARAARRGRTQLMDPAALAEIAPDMVDASSDTPSIGDYLSLIEDERQREACRLHFVEGLKLEAVGKRLGVSTSTAFRLLRNAQEVLRIQLGATADPPEGVK